MAFSTWRISRGGNRIGSWLVSALIILLGLIGSACSDESDDSSQEFGALLRSTSPEQAELLADGELTLAEYEKAFFSFVACLEDRGIRVFDTEFDGGFNYSTMNPDTPEGQAKFNLDHGECRSQHFDEIELAWADVNADPDADAAFYEAVANCVRGEGVEVSGTSPAELSDAIRRAPAIYHQCIDNVVLESHPQTRRAP